MIRVAYAPAFVRYFKKLEPALQREALEKIALFKDTKNHPALHVHKLKGLLAGRYSFSINFKYRTLFMWLSKTEAVLLAIGDHALYD